MKYNFDIAVIGGGPGGYVAAIKSAQLGKKVCLIEKTNLGGVCLNRGCIPTKTIIKSVNVLDCVQNAAKFGIVGLNTDNYYLDLNILQKRKKQVVNRLTGGVSSLLKANGVKVINGTASFKDEHTLYINQNTITAENIIIATGSVPIEPPISKEGNVPLINSDDVLEIKEVPKEMVIVGGGVIGIEFAYILNKLGTLVTIIELQDEILPTIDKEIAKKIRSTLKKQGVIFHTGTQVTKFVNNEIYYKKDGDVKSLKADKIFVSVGRRPNVTELNLKAIEIKTSKNCIQVNNKLQTNYSNIYAIGDVNGKYMLAHVASMEGIIAVENICGNDNVSMEYTKIPQCIYLNPEVASIGITEQEAIEKGLNIKVGRFNLSANGKALVEGAEDGFIKVIIDQKLGEILGVHMIGPHVTDIISELVVAMKLEGTAEEMVYAIHPHPTISEVIPEAFHAALGKAIHAI